MAAKASQWQAPTCSQGPGSSRTRRLIILVPHLRRGSRTTASPILSCGMTVGNIFVAGPFLSRTLEAQTYGITRSVSYSAVACATLITWDVLITFSEEVDFIWRRERSVTTYMYIVARYVPWMVLLALLPVSVNGSTGLKFTPGQCNAWQFVQGVLLQVTITTVDVILITRVYALYRQSRILLQILVGLFVAEFAFLCYVLVASNPKIAHEDECFVTSSPTFFKYYWVVSLLFETILFALTMHKFIEAVHHGWGRSSVMQRFVTDGTWAYALIFLVMLVNMLLYEYAHSPLAGICYTWLVVVLSFAGSRLILNPRRAFASRQESISDDESSHIELTRLSSGLSGSSTRAPAYAPISGARHGLDPGHRVVVTIETVSDRAAVDAVACPGRDCDWRRSLEWASQDTLHRHPTDDGYV